jgi:glycosyltransferase involved in cell wall biosynthesis
MKKILFISHASSISGAPIILLNLLRDLIKFKEFSFDTISLLSGPLDNEFEKLPGSTGHLAQPSKTSVKLWMKKFKSYDLIYANTIASLPAAIIWKKRSKCPLILHMHEMQNAIEMLVAFNEFSEMIKEVDLFIAVSKAVSRNLVDRYKIPEEKITLVYESIPLPVRIDKRIEDIMFQQFVKDSFVIGGAGPICWRKGTDLFLLTAKKIKDNQLPYKFVWVGDDSGSHEFKQLQYDITNLGLGDTVFLTGTLRDPFSYYDRMNLFFLSSREDPFPLVCLETGAMAKPVLCFEESGGITELLEDNPSDIIPYASITEAANKIQWYAENPTETKKIGLNLQNKIVENFDIYKAAENINQLIFTLINESEN